MQYFQCNKYCDLPLIKHFSRPRQNGYILYLIMTSMHYRWSIYVYIYVVSTVFKTVHEPFLSEYSVGDSLCREYTRPDVSCCIGSDSVINKRGKDQHVIVYRRSYGARTFQYPYLYKPAYKCIYFMYSVIKKLQYRYVCRQY